ncbi:MAG: amino acid permease [Deltaproteobacteria bacterium]|nr:amino acid permease [Deltaproteobacteria bacterium]
MKKLERALTLFPVSAIVIGSVVGSGIFVVSADMARGLGSAPLLLLVWLITGLMTLLGAFTQCELVAQMPVTGGLYTYLREIFGERIGFLYGWANFMIAGSGAIAALAFIFANYLGEFVTLPRLSPELEKLPVTIPFIGSFFPLADLGTKTAGALLIAVLTALNMRGVKLGALVQSVSTSSKILVILFVVLAAFSASGSVSHFSGVAPGHVALGGWALIGAIGMAMSGAFWSYDGWGNVAYIAGEVRDPSKTIPRAIVLGTFGFISLYLLINLAYLYVLPIEAVGASPHDRVAATMMETVMGHRGAMLVAALIILSSADTSNSTILTNARVYYAMAHRQVFSPRCGEVHSRFHTPHLALLYQGLWSIVLLMSGSFDLITSMYVFVNWLLYILMAVGVFVLRYRHPARARPYKTPGYPFVPGLFILLSAIFLIVTLVTDIQAFRAGQQPAIKSVMGLLLVFSGLPFYLYWKRASARLQLNTGVSGT